MSGDRVLAVIFSLIAIAFLYLVWVGPRYNSMHGETAWSPAPSPVGTSGHQPFLDSAVSESSMRTVRAITSAEDPLKLVGRRIEFYLNAPYPLDPRGFWVGNNENRLLVVYAPNVITSPQTGRAVRISGTVQAIPSVEEQTSWGLDASQRQDVEREKVYVLADTVRAR